MAIMLDQTWLFLSIMIYPDVHVRVFNFVVKESVDTSENYIINAFNYMLRDTTLN
jgi:hypothetical protein